MSSGQTWRNVETHQAILVIPIPSKSLVLHLFLFMAMISMGNSVVASDSLVLETSLDSYVGKFCNPKCWPEGQSERLQTLHFGIY